jgi:radical SAM/Cys-rich protein
MIDTFWRMGYFSGATPWMATNRNEMACEEFNGDHRLRATPKTSAGHGVRHIVDQWDFAETVRSSEGDGVLNALDVNVLQVNVGKLCNQACQHCHVEAGPKRTEQMTQDTAQRVVQLMDASPSIHTLDLTGGAPELNPSFRYLVREAHQRNVQVIDRCNLTVLFEPGQADTARFLADHQVEVVASLPCYSLENVEKQRGKGVFGKSIRALQWLNTLGYGGDATGLRLNLVYNPLGAFLPPEQQGLEKDYKSQLLEHFGIVFNQLYTITNMPIKRFADQLIRQNKVQSYMDLLVNSFNRQTVEGLMCRRQISIGWDGVMYDCDFNQMLELPVGLSIDESRPTVFDVASLDDLVGRRIVTGGHCFGCTAGAGSSCGGALE